MENTVISGCRHIIYLAIVLSLVLGLYKIANECNKIYKEIRCMRIEMVRSTVTAKGCTKKVVDEISAVREEGTKVRIWFW